MSHDVRHPIEPKTRLNAHLYVTPACNLNCPHCYYNARLSLTTPPDALAISTMLEIIETACELYDARFDIEGGEMFLRRGIGELFAALTTNVRQRLTITTNGMARVTIAPEILRELEEVRVSVEGHTDDLQRDLRGIGLAPVLRTAESIMRAGVPVTLRITLHKRNHALVGEMLESFVARGFSHFSLYEFQSSGRGTALAKSYSLDDTDVERVLDQLAALPEVSHATTIKYSLSRCRALIVESHRLRLEAHGFMVVDVSGVASITCDYDGSLGVCPWNIGGLRIGSVQPNGFRSELRRLMQANALSHKCDHCSAVRVVRSATMPQQDEMARLGVGGRE